MPVVVLVAVTPVPVIVLFLLVGLCKIVILLVVFLEVLPVSPILAVIPFMGIVVSFVFVAPALLLMVTILCAGCGNS